MFVTVNPENVKEMVIEGAKFTIGSIPYQKFLELQGQCRAGLDNKKELVLAVSKSNIDFVKWGVKGHGDIQYADGKDVPFKTDKVEFQGKSFDIVSDETIQAYFPKNLYVDIASAVITYNMMSEVEEKN